MPEATEPAVPRRSPDPKPAKKEKRTRRTRGVTVEVADIDRDIHRWLVRESRVNERDLSGQIRYILREAYMEAPTTTLASTRAADGSANGAD